MTTNQSPEGLAKFLDEAAQYFEKRPTGGEDMAFWANLNNAENCRKAAAFIRDHTGEGDALLRRFVEAYDGMETGDGEPCPILADARNHLSRTPDREPFDRKAVRTTHAYKPDPEYPWFCADCGYAEHERLKHHASTKDGEQP